MSLYSDTRDKIYTLLTSVAGIGKVFKSQRYPKDWEAFFNLYRDNDTNLCVVVFMTLINPITENITEEDAAVDANRQIQIVQRSETWKISLIYAFKDDDTNPSEYAFQELCENIEEKFRFLQDLDGSAFQSWPLQTVLRDVGTWTASVMVHKCDFHLQIEHRIVSTETE